MPSRRRTSPSASPRGLGSRASKCAPLSTSAISTIGLNLRVAPNDGLQLLALAVRLAPPLDDAQEFGMLHQKRDQRITLAVLHGSTVMIEGAKHHLHRHPLQRLAQGLGHLLANRQQHRIED